MDTDSRLMVFFFQLFEHAIPLPSGPHCLDEKSAVILTEDSFYIRCHSSLASFRIPFLFLTFSRLTMTCLGVHLFEFTLLGKCAACLLCRLLFSSNFVSLWLLFL